MSHKPLIIAVDGPAGAGKSSICSRACQKLGWTYVNTGAIYRAVAWLAHKNAIDLADEQAMLKTIEQLLRDMEWVPEKQQLLYRGECLGKHLYTAEATAAASFVAKMGKARERLLPIQRELALKAPVGAIVDGRDIGTVVFPDADLKVFMTASLEERAKRRGLQISQATGDDGQVSEVEIKRIADEISKRDAQDSGRDSAPLSRPEGAVDFDNSGMGMETAVDRLIDLFKAHDLV